MVSEHVRRQFHWRFDGLRTGPPAKLVLKDGNEYYGYSFGYFEESKSYDDPSCVEDTGEVVFSTAMVGYTEALTDPSFLGQILVFTYPILGNYGVPPGEQDEFGLHRWFESTKIRVKGVVTCDYTINESHWTSVKSLAAWLKEQKIPAIAGIDTRALTKHLRDKGSMLGRIILGEAALGRTDPNLLREESFNDPNKSQLLDLLQMSSSSLYSLSEEAGSRYVSRFEFDIGRVESIISEDKWAFNTLDPKRDFPKNCVFDKNLMNTNEFDKNLVSRSGFDGEACFEDSEGNVYSKDLDRSKLIVIVDCGMKNNILRSVLRLSPEKTNVLVVPWYFDFTIIPYDGLVVSNGPGDPQTAEVTIKHLKKAMERPVPIFAICFGHQLLGLASGAKIHKMLHGNRGFNQPCIDLRTYKCYATSQNHGFAISEDSLQPGWSTLFTNANDNSVEGIIHMINPWVGVQFHPEASGGPTDTKFLIRDFLYSIVKRHTIPLHIRSTAPHVICKRILLLSSGGLSIGQAGEFDYSGSQAIKALREAGAEVILVNPNVATVQTSHGLANVIYFQPITFEFVSKIIEKERPDGIMCGFGGQTALNCGIELYKSGFLEKYNCKVLGTPIETILNTEDRGMFKTKIEEVGEKCAPSKVAHSVEGCIKAVEELGYPVLVRTNFALGGFGSGFANNLEELLVILSKIYTEGQTEEVDVYLDKALKGWKEIEFEIMRDFNDNCVAAASMENLDPLSIHTGDSIVVAPAQTLNNVELYKLREVAFKVVRHLGIVGECNIQFAVNPENDDYFIVELNARLSRSSALASKATGYPLAYVAAKIALGYDLVQMRNAITLVTTACYEPNLDYIVVKVPKWDLRKFEFASDSIGSGMKSVGEVMAIGKTFEEAIQKALRMAGDNVLGFESGLMSQESLEVVLSELKNPTPNHVAAISRAFDLGVSVKEIHKMTMIDEWFLNKLMNIHKISKMISEVSSLESIDAGMMRCIKCFGFSDKQIASLLSKQITEDTVRSYRKKLDVFPVVKLIDTVAAEYPAKTNYCYITYNGIENDVTACRPVGSSEHPAIIVLGCGPYRIGSSIEFDWSAVSCVRTLRNLGYAAIILNCNPETVSTDFDVSNRLYFEELSIEIVDSIYNFENPMGVVISVGGQTANNLACKLSELGISILGTSAESIDQCESRNKFSKLCDYLNIDQPPWEEFTSFEAAKQFCDKVSFPVLVRPSYVLSGASMRVILSLAELEKFLQTSAVVNREHPVVISKFIENAKEVEIDCVSSQGMILNYAISEHVECAGTHSGDATLILPAQNIFVGTQRRVKKITQKLSRYLNISGPFNVQFICKNNELKIIECNLRASRTLPFVSKTLNVNFIDQATRVMVGAPTRVCDIQLMDFNYVAVKMPVFSFERLYPADPLLGVEMKSTGEVAAFGINKYEALLKAMIASGMRLPRKAILISLSGRIDKFILSRRIQCLLSLGLDVYATEETFNFIKIFIERDRDVLDATDTDGDRPSTIEEIHSILSSHLDFVGDFVTDTYKDSSSKVKMGRLLLAYKPSDGRSPNALKLLKSNAVDMFINVTDCVNPVQASDGYLMRRAATDYRVSLITTSKLALLTIDALMVRHIKTLRGKLFFQNKSHHEYAS